MTIYTAKFCKEMLLVLQRLVCLRGLRSCTEPGSCPVAARGRRSRPGRGCSRLSPPPGSRPPATPVVGQQQ